MGIWHQEMTGMLVKFQWSPTPRKQSTKKTQNSGENSGPRGPCEDILMLRGKNRLPTVSRQFLTRNYPHPDCLLKCLPKCRYPTREDFFACFEIALAARVTARQLSGKNCLAANFALLHLDASPGPLGTNLGDEFGDLPFCNFSSLTLSRLAGEFGGQTLRGPGMSGWLRNRTGTGNRNRRNRFFPKPNAEPEPPEPFSRNRNRNRNRPFLLNCTEIQKNPFCRGTAGTENRNRLNRSISKP